MEGWVKIHRKLLDNPIVMKDTEHFAVWVYLLLNATHKQHPAVFDGEKIILQPGQLITGRKKISSATKVSESKVRRILKSFKSDHQIDQRTTSQGSLISILNWVKYQESDQQTDQQVTNKWPTSDQQVTTIQECKNGKNGKNDYSFKPEEIKKKSDYVLSQIEKGVY